MKEKVSYNDYDDDDDDDDDDNNVRDDVSVDVVDEKWKKQRYTSNQLRKKLDAVSTAKFGD